MLHWRLVGRSTYERLSAQESSFVKFEGAGIPVHISAIAVFGEAPADDDTSVQGETARTTRTQGGFPNIERIRAQVGSRLHLIPRYRRRLAFTPLQGHPIWVDDETFDLSYHVRHAALPHPGTDAQLHEFASQIVSQPLDLSRPLWELWLVEGLANGGFGLVAKIHHCMVDGVSGVGVMTALLSPTAQTAIDPAPAWKPRPMPGMLRFLGDSLEGGTRRGLETLRWLQSSLLRPIETVGALLDTTAMGWDTLRAGLTSPDETPLTAPIGRQRRIDCRRLDLAEVRDVRKRLDGSVNDVVLTVVAGAMRSFLRRRRVKLGGLDFRVVVPVDTRTGEEDEHVGNRVSAWFLSLPLAERSARQRFLKIRSQTRHLKKTHAERGVDAFLRFADWAGSTRLPFWGVNLVNWMRPYNLIVTNVHGPQFPLYLLGAPLRDFTPAIPLFQNQALSVAAVSYLGGLYFGITGDRDLVPDLERFGDALDASFEELKRVAENP